MNTNKTIALVSVGLVAGLVLGSVGVSYASTGTAASTASRGTGVGIGAVIRDTGARLIDIVADLTGLPVEEIQAERADGSSLADIAEANGVLTETVVDEALAAREAILDEKVADGSITQEQADIAYDEMTERVTERVTTDEVGRPSWTGSAGATGSGSGSGSMGGQGGSGVRDGSCIVSE